ncbi:MAG: BNR-4 repeat-containing protein [Lewinellaceae bacterium]|nr:BNR-4 repeat-containing protein [Lewinellaceae bacterium]
MLSRSLLCAGLILFSGIAAAQKKATDTRLVKVGEGWAQNSANTVIFRKNSLATFRDTQFIAYYDAAGNIVLGKRKLGSSHWQLQQLPHQGQAADAHNALNIMADGAGYLHVAWSNHNGPLYYCRSESPGSLSMTALMPMAGELEGRVTYPEFYRMPNGNLLFLYRDGQSGQGNLAIQQYDVQAGRWSQVQRNLIDGEGQRNAYWQACIGPRGLIHLSWVWRESPDVSTNHDMAYARSADGGKTWERSTGEPYDLPIRAATAEYACHIPQQRELINQTSMSVDEAGRPYIAAYWKEPGDSAPQYRLVYKDEVRWVVQNLGFRQTDFSLSGMGTKRIPISRPQIVTWQQGKKRQAAILFRDEERGSRVSVAINRDIRKNRWKIRHLWEEPVGSWEPTYDTELWKEQGVLNLFVQKVEQADAEGLSALPPQPVGVLEWEPRSQRKR